MNKFFTDDKIFVKRLEIEVILPKRYIKNYYNNNLNSIIFGLYRSNSSYKCLKENFMIFYLDKANSIEKSKNFILLTNFGEKSYTETIDCKYVLLNFYI